jgi:hypothetical protein
MRRVVILASLLVASPALAQEMPARKAGLWEMKMNMQMLSPAPARAGGERGAMPAQVFQHCIDAATDKKMSITGATRADQCSRQEVKHSGNTITMDSVCNVGRGNVISHAVVSGDFNSAYTMKVNSKHDPAAPGFPDTDMTIEAKWLGACKADQKPGDIIMANGTKMNVNDMQKGGPGGMPPGMRK